MSLCGVSVVVPKVAKLEENAQVAGLEIGDEILAVDGMETADSNAVAQAIADSNGDAVTLTVRRDGQTLDLTITPFYDEDDGRYRVGFSFGRENMRLPIWSSIPFSVRYNIESVKTILDALKNMVFRGKGVDDMTGPVGTIYVIQEVTRQGGFEVYLEMLALISVNLGVMNLLPIPALDGGRIVCLLITVVVEAITKKKINPKYEGYLHGAGMILLLALMAIIMFKDVIFLFKR